MKANTKGKRKMKILIVGAGAVGAVYGRYFQLGGANVSFLVREKYAENCRKGFHFYKMNRPKAERDSPIEMKNFEILTRMNEVASQKWDYGVLAISSTALRGPWLDELIQALGSTPLVTLQPGLNDREYLLQHLSSDRLIEGMIPIVSYIAPLPGESASKRGIAYWFPPGASGPMSGEKNNVEPLIRVLLKGGFPARLSRDARQEALIPSTILSIFIAALEAADWSFQKLSKGPELTLACQALPEAFRIVAHHRGIRTPVLLPHFVRPSILRAIMKWNHWVVPFDLQTCLRVHFTKVQDQMHQGLKDYVTLAHAYSIPAPSINLLYQKVISR